jgi:antitoxin YefM
MATYIKQIHDTKRPLIITQRGKSVAVLIDTQVFEAIQEKIELPPCSIPSVGGPEFNS